MLRVLLMLSLVACGDDFVAEDAGASDASASDILLNPRIEVGGGLLAFEPFGESAEMVMGIQGGWHIDVSTRFYDLDAVDLELVIEGFDPDSGEQLTSTVDRLLQDRHTEETAPGVRTRAGDRLIFNIESPSEIAGRAVLIRAFGTSAGGVEAMGEATVVVVDEDP